MAIIINFSSILTKRFFTLPKKESIPIKRVDFPLPHSAAEIPHFLHTAQIVDTDEGRMTIGHLTVQGQLFKKGVAELLAKLRQWSIDNGISDELVQSSIQFFWHANFRFGDPLIFKDGKTPKLVKEIPDQDPFILPANISADLFQLYTEGVQLLATIVELVNSDEFSLQVRKNIITTLWPTLLCDSGSHGNLYNAYLRLQNNPQIELMSIRRRLAEDTAIELIEQDPTIDLDSHLGDEIHFVYRVLNEVATKIAIEPIHDDKMPSRDQTLRVSTRFTQHLPLTLSAERIINSLIAKMNLPDFKNHLAENPIEALEHFIRTRLDIYGIDEDFNNYHLLDASTFLLRDDVHQYLTISLLKRLGSNNYFNLSSTQIDDRLSPAIVHWLPSETVNAYGLSEGVFIFNSLRLAYVIDPTSNDQSRTPFIPYCIQRVMNGDMRILSILTEAAHCEEIAISLLNHLIMEAETKVLDVDWIDNVNDLLSRAELQWVLREAPLDKILDLVESLAQNSQALLVFVQANYLIETPFQLARLIVNSPTQEKRILMETYIELLIQPNFFIEFSRLHILMNLFSQSWPERLDEVAKQAKICLFNAEQLAQLLFVIPPEHQLTFIQYLGSDYLKTLIRTPEDLYTFLAGGKRENILDTLLIIGENHLRDIQVDVFVLAHLSSADNLTLLNRLGKEYVTTVLCKNSLDLVGILTYTSIDGALEILGKDTFNNIISDNQELMNFITHVTHSKDLFSKFFSAFDFNHLLKIIPDYDVVLDLLEDINPNLRLDFLQALGDIVFARMETMNNFLRTLDALPVEDQTRFVELNAGAIPYLAKNIHDYITVIAKCAPEHRDRIVSLIPTDFLLQLLLDLSREEKIKQLAEVLKLMPVNVNFLAMIHEEQLNKIITSTQDLHLLMLSLDFFDRSLTLELLPLSFLQQRLHNLQEINLILETLNKGSRLPFLTWLFQSDKDNIIDPIIMILKDAPENERLKFLSSITNYVNDIVRTPLQLKNLLAILRSQDHLVLFGKLMLNEHLITLIPNGKTLVSALEHTEEPYKASCILLLGEKIKTEDLRNYENAGPEIYDALKSAKLRVGRDSLYARSHADAPADNRPDRPAQDPSQKL